MEVSRARMGPCCCRTKKRSVKATPLPLARIFLLSMVLFANTLGSLFVFPFLAFMVHDFFPELDKDQLGKEAGYLGSVYYLGNFVGSLIWGALSDAWGRRPVLLLGMAGSIVSILAFGFSQSFAWAIVTRLMWGLLNGNLGVAKTYVAEICDNSNQARGFIILQVVAASGRLMGAVVGGFLSQPADKYATFHSEFFCHFPYLLPCIVVVGFASFALLIACLFLDETLHLSKAYNQESTSSDSSSTSASEGTAEVVELTANGRQSCEHVALETSDVAIMESDIDSQSDAESATFEISESETLLKLDERKEEGEEEEEEERRGIQRRRSSLQYLHPVTCGEAVFSKARQRVSECWACSLVLVSCCTACYTGLGRLGKNPNGVWPLVQSKLKSGLKKLRLIVFLLKDRGVFVSTAIYGGLAFIVSMSNEVFPLLMVTEHKDGGYTLDGNEIGMILTVVAVVQIPFQLFFYPTVAKAIGYRWITRLAILLFACACTLLPFSNQITGPINPGSSHNSNLSSNSSANINSTAESMWLNTTTADIDDNSNSMLSTNSCSSIAVKLEANLSTNSSAFCKLSSSGEEEFVNENSLKRIPISVWSILCGVMVVLVTTRTTFYTSISVMVSNSVVSRTRGTVNGLSQSVVALGRSSGPTVGSLIFAWSECNGKGWPLNFHFVFLVCVVGSLTTLAVSFLLPKAIEKKKIEDSSIT